MITNALILVALFIINLIVFIFPASTGFPDEVSTAVTALGGYAGIVNPIFPLDTLATILGLVITFELVVFAFKGLKWVMSHIPYVGGRG